MYYGWRKHIWFKIVALAVAGVFLLQDISWASRNDLRYSAKPSQPSHSEKAGIADFFKDIASMLVPSANAAEDDVLPTELDSQGKKTIPASNPNTYKKPTVTNPQVCAYQDAVAVHAYAAPVQTANVVEVTVVETPEPCQETDTVVPAEPAKTVTVNKEEVKDITPVQLVVDAPVTQDNSPSVYVQSEQPATQPEQSDLLDNNAVKPQETTEENPAAPEHASQTIDTVTAVVAVVDQSKANQIDTNTQIDITVAQVEAQSTAVENQNATVVIVNQMNDTDSGDTQHTAQNDLKTIGVSDVIIKDQSAADLVSGHETVLPPLDNVYIPQCPAAPVQAPVSQPSQQGQNNQNSQTAALTAANTTIDGDQSYTIINDTDTVANDQWKVPASCGPPKQTTTSVSTTVNASHDVNCAVFSAQSYTTLSLSEIAKIAHENNLIDSDGFTSAEQYQTLISLLGTELNVRKGTVEDLSMLNDGATALIVKDGVNHWVSGVRVDGDTVSYMDNGEKVTESADEFNKKFTGYFLTEEEGVGTAVSREAARQVRGAVWPWDAAAAWVNNNIIKPVTNFVNTYIVQPVIRTARNIYTGARNYATNLYNSARNYVATKAQQYAAQVQKAASTVQSIASATISACVASFLVNTVIMNTLRASLGLTKDQLPDPTKIEWENDPEKGLQIHIEGDSYALDVNVNMNDLGASGVTGVICSTDEDSYMILDGTLNDPKEEKTDFKASPAGNSSDKDNPQQNAQAVINAYNNGGVAGAQTAIDKIRQTKYAVGTYGGETITGGYVADENNPNNDVYSSGVVYDITVTSATPNGYGGWTYDMDKSIDLLHRDNTWCFNSTDYSSETGDNLHYMESCSLTFIVDGQGNPIQRVSYQNNGNVGTVENFSDADGDGNYTSSYIVNDQKGLVRVVQTNNIYKNYQMVSNLDPKIDNLAGAIFYYTWDGTKFVPNEQSGSGSRDTRYEYYLSVAQGIAGSVDRQEGVDYSGWDNYLNDKYVKSYVEYAGFSMDTTNSATNMSSAKYMKEAQGNLPGAWVLNARNLPAFAREAEVARLEGEYGISSWWTVIHGNGEVNYGEYRNLLEQASKNPDYVPLLMTQLPVSVQDQYKASPSKDLWACVAGYGDIYSVAKADDIMKLRPTAADQRDLEAAYLLLRLGRVSMNGTRAGYDASDATRLVKENNVFQWIIVLQQSDLASLRSTMQFASDYATGEDLYRIMSANEREAYYRVPDELRYDMSYATKHESLTLVDLMTWVKYSNNNLQDGIKIYHLDTQSRAAFFAADEKDQKAFLAQITVKADKADLLSKYPTDSLYGRDYYFNGNFNFVEEVDADEGKYKVFHNGTWVDVICTDSNGKPVNLSNVRDAGDIYAVGINVRPVDPNAPQMQDAATVVLAWATTAPGGVMSEFSAAMGGGLVWASLRINQTTGLQWKSDRMYAKTQRTVAVNVDGKIVYTTVTVDTQSEGQSFVDNLRHFFIGFIPELREKAWDAVADETTLVFTGRDGKTIIDTQAVLKPKLSWINDPWTVGKVSVIVAAVVIIAVVTVKTLGTATAPLVSALFSALTSTVAVAGYAIMAAALLINHFVIKDYKKWTDAYLADPDQTWGDKAIYNAASLIQYLDMLGGTPNATNRASWFDGQVIEGYDFRWGDVAALAIYLSTGLLNGGVRAAIMSAPSALRNAGNIATASLRNGTFLETVGKYILYGTTKVTLQGTVRQAAWAKVVNWAYSAGLKNADIINRHIAVQIAYAAFRLTCVEFPRFSLYMMTIGPMIKIAAGIAFALPCGKESRFAAFREALLGDYYRQSWEECLASSLIMAWGWLIKPVGKLVLMPLGVVNASTWGGYFAKPFELQDFMTPLFYFVVPVTSLFFSRIPVFNRFLTMDNIKLFKEQGSVFSRLANQMVDGTLEEGVKERILEVVFFETTGLKARIGDANVQTAVEFFEAGKGDAANVDSQYKIDGLDEIIGSIRPDVVSKALNGPTTISPAKTSNPVRSSGSKGGSTSDKKITASKKASSGVPSNTGSNSGSRLSQVVGNGLRAISSYVGGTMGEEQGRINVPDFSGLINMIGSVVGGVMNIFKAVGSRAVTTVTDASHTVSNALFTVEIVEKATQLVGAVIGGVMTTIMAVGVRTTAIRTNVVNSFKQLTNSEDRGRLTVPALSGSPVAAAVLTAIVLPVIAVKNAVSDLSLSDIRGGLDIWTKRILDLATIKHNALIPAGIFTAASANTHKETPRAAALPQAAQTTSARYTHSADLPAGVVFSVNEDTNKIFGTNGIIPVNIEVNVQTGLAPPLKVIYFFFSSFFKRVNAAARLNKIIAQVQDAQASSSRSGSIKGIDSAATATSAGSEHSAKTTDNTQSAFILKNTVQAINGRQESVPNAANVPALSVLINAMKIRGPPVLDTLRVFLSAIISYATKALSSGWTKIVRLVKKSLKKLGAVVGGMMKVIRTGAKIGASLASANSKLPSYSAFIATLYVEFDCKPSSSTSISTVAGVLAYAAATASYIFGRDLFNTAFNLPWQVANASEEGAAGSILLQGVPSTVAGVGRSAVSFINRVKHGGVSWSRSLMKSFVSPMSLSSARKTLRSLLPAREDVKPAFSSLSAKKAGFTPATALSRAGSFLAKTKAGSSALRSAAQFRNRVSLSTSLIALQARWLAASPSAIEALKRAAVLAGTVVLCVRTVAADELNEYGEYGVDSHGTAVFTAGALLLVFMAAAMLAAWYFSTHDTGLHSIKLPVISVPAVALPAVDLSRSIAWIKAVGKLAVIGAMGLAALVYGLPAAAGVVALVSAPVSIVPGAALTVGGAMCLVSTVSWWWKFREAQQAKPLHSVAQRTAAAKREKVKYAGVAAAGMITALAVAHFFGFIDMSALLKLPTVAGTVVFNGIARTFGIKGHGAEAPYLRSRPDPSSARPLNSFIAVLKKAISGYGWMKVQIGQTVKRFGAVMRTFSTQRVLKTLMIAGTGVSAMITALICGMDPVSAALTAGGEPVSSAAGLALGLIAAGLLALPVVARTTAWMKAKTVVLPADQEIGYDEALERVEEAKDTYGGGSMQDNQEWFGGFVRERLDEGMAAINRVFEPSTALIIGAGPTLVEAKVLLERFDSLERVVLVDFLSENVASLRSALAGEKALQEKITIVQADARNLPFAGKEFDLVYSARAIAGEIHRDAVDLQSAWTEAVRMINDNGMAVIFRNVFPKEYSLPPFNVRYPDPPAKEFSVIAVQSKSGDEQVGETIVIDNKKAALNIKPLAAYAGLCVASVAVIACGLPLLLAVPLFIASLSGLALNMRRIIAGESPVWAFGSKTHIRSVHQALAVAQLYDRAKTPAAGLNVRALLTGVPAGILNFFTGAAVSYEKRCRFAEGSDNEAGIAARTAAFAREYEHASALSRARFLLSGYWVWFTLKRPMLAGAVNFVAMRVTLALIGIAVADSVLAGFVASGVAGEAVLVTRAFFAAMGLSGLSYMRYADRLYAISGNKVIAAVAAFGLIAVAPVGFLARAFPGSRYSSLLVSSSVSFWQCFLGMLTLGTVISFVVSLNPTLSQVASVGGETVSYAADVNETVETDADSLTDIVLDNETATTNDTTTNTTDNATVVSVQEPGVEPAEEVVYHQPVHQPVGHQAHQHVQYIDSVTVAVPAQPAMTMQAGIQAEGIQDNSSVPAVQDESAYTELTTHYIGPLPLWMAIAGGVFTALFAVPALLKKALIPAATNVHAETTDAATREMSAREPGFSLSWPLVYGLARELGFNDPKDADTAKAVASTVYNALQGKQLREVMDRDMKGFNDWVKLVGLEEEISALAADGLKTYVLFQAVRLANVRLASTVPQVRFYLFAKALMLQSRGVKNVGEQIAVEAQAWWGYIQPAYRQGKTKDQFVTDEDIKDIFEEEDFVQRLLTNGDYAGVIDGWQNDPQAWKTYADTLGDWGNLRRNTAAGLVIGIAAAGALLALGLSSGVIQTIVFLGLIGAVTGVSSAVCGLRGWKVLLRNFWQFPAAIAGSLAVTVVAVFVPGALACLSVAVPVVAAIALGYAFYQPHKKLQQIKNHADVSLDPGQEALLEKRIKRETRISVALWSAVLASKSIWNYLVFSWLAVPTYAALAAGTAPLWAWAFIGGMWMIFVLFFILDIFTFYYGWQSLFSLALGYNSGLGRITSWKDVNASWKKYYRMQAARVNAGTGASMSNDIFENMYDFDYINADELKRFQGGDMSAAPVNKEAKDRIVFLLNSWGMDLQELPAYKDLLKLTAAITSNDELIRYTLKTLNEAQKGVGLTLLTHLIKAKPDEWANLLERLKVLVPAVPAQQWQAWLALSGEEAFDFSLCGNLSAADRALVTTAVEEWASMRYQTLLRTVQGLATLRQAYEWLMKNVYFPERANDRDFIEARINEKLQLIWAYQQLEGLKTKNDDRYRHVQELREKYPYIEVVSLTDFESKMVTGYPGKSREYAVPANYGIHAHYKANNQNNYASYVTGDIVLFFDANCAVRFEDALKVPQLLEEFNQDELLAGINVPEYIITKAYNWIGKAHGFGDEAWTGSNQRFLSAVGAIGFYGHGAFFRTEVVREFGVLTPDYVSEDLMMAILSWLKDKGYYIAHKEYLRLGKGREVSIAAGAIPFQKFAAGAAELLMGRQMQRLFAGHAVNWYQKWALLATLGFYVRKPLVMLAVPAYIALVMFLGISGFASFPLVFTLAFVGIIFSQIISVNGLVQLVLEKGIVRGLVRFIRIFPCLVMVFPAYIPVYAIGFIRGLQGKAQFITSRKGTELEQFSIAEKIYRRFDGDRALTSTESFRLQIQVSSVFVFLAFLSLYIWQTAAMLYSGLFLVMIVLWMFAPMVTAPGMLPTTTGYLDMQQGLASGWKKWASTWKSYVLDGIYDLSAESSRSVKFFRAYDLAIAVFVVVGIAFFGFSWPLALFMLPATSLGMMAIVFAAGSLYFAAAGLKRSVASLSMPRMIKASPFLHDQTGSAFMPVFGGNARLPYYLFNIDNLGETDKNAQKAREFYMVEENNELDSASLEKSFAGKLSVRNAAAGIGDEWLKMGFTGEESFDLMAGRVYTLLSSRLAGVWPNCCGGAVWLLQEMFRDIPLIDVQARLIATYQEAECGSGFHCYAVVTDAQGQSWLFDPTVEQFNRDGGFIADEFGCYGGIEQVLWPVLMSMLKVAAKASGWSKIWLRSFKRSFKRVLGAVVGMFSKSYRINGQRVWFAESVSVNHATTTVIDIADVYSADEFERVSRRLIGLPESCLERLIAINIKFDTVKPAGKP